jgi:hypothetical protein
MEREGDADMGAEVEKEVKQWRLIRPGVKKVGGRK